MAVTLLIVGIAIVSVNVYVSWLRMPLLNTLRKGTVARWASGLPLIGSPALWLSAWLLPEGSRLIPIALGMSLLDTGGPHWFAATQAWHALRGRRGDRS